MNGRFGDKTVFAHILNTSVLDMIYYDIASLSSFSQLLVCNVISQCLPVNVCFTNDAMTLHSCLVCQRSLCTVIGQFRLTLYRYD